jgi:hypothetical protein
VLEARDRDLDARPRPGAGQPGQRAGPLGAFDQAKAKLYEARFIFEEFGDHDSMRTVRGVLDEVANHR